MKRIFRMRQIFYKIGAVFCVKFYSLLDRKLFSDKAMKISEEKTVAKEISIKTNNNFAWLLPDDQFLACRGFLTKQNYARVASEQISECSSELKYNAKISAGCRIEMTTDASYIYVNILLSKFVSQFDLHQMSFTGFSGIDVYCVEDGVYRWKGCFSPNKLFGTRIFYKVKISDESEKKKKKIVIYLPNFVPVKSIKIGLNCDAVVWKNSQNEKKPIVFYGSSISQGCASSRPGLSYIA